MKALVFNGTLKLTEVPKPLRKPGEALVRVTMAGICNTDVEITRGYMNFRGVPGHEFVGVVEAADNHELLNARVVGEINAGCGQCSWCARGLERHCPNRTVLGIAGRDGAFAEYCVLPEKNLVRLPYGLSDEKAVFTEPVAAAMEVLEQVKIEPSYRVMVLGDGKLGLLMAMVLRLTGCSLLLVGKHRDKLELFGRSGGSYQLLNEFVAGSERFDVVVETSGSPSGWGLAVDRVRPRGTLVLKSTYHGSLDFNPAVLVINEVTVIGSRCGRFAPAIRVLEMGLVDPIPLISAVYPFDRAEEAFRKAQEAGVLKVLLKK